MEHWNGLNAGKHTHTHTHTLAQKLGTTKSQLCKS